MNELSGNKVLKIGAQSGLILFFILSRILLLILGITFKADYRFMFIHDLELLKNDFWETIYYTHAFTPFMNLLIALVQFISEEHDSLIFHFLYILVGLLLTIGFYRLILLFQFSKRTAFLTSAFFSITPAFIYFEALLLYTLPTAALLVGAALLFSKALRKNDLKSWSYFFLLCSLICLVRTSFHLVWLVSLLVFLVVIQLKDLRRIGLAFSLPFAIVAGWYLKNLLLFGFFGASSFSGFNLSFTTVERLTKNEKTELVEKGELSSLASIPIYSGINAYAPYVSYQEKRDIGVLDQVRKSNGSFNFNHWGFIEISKMKLADNKKYLTLYPDRYFKTVLKGFFDYFNPSTRWHPLDDKPHRSPHTDHRAAIGGWERVYNMAIHSLPFPGMGFYTFFLIFFFINLFSLIWRLVSDGLTYQDKLNAFLTLNIGYLTLLSCMVTYGELERYRFMVEPFIWIIILLSLRNLSDVLGRSQGLSLTLIKSAFYQPDNHKDPDHR